MCVWLCVCTVQATAIKEKNCTGKIEMYNVMEKSKTVHLVKDKDKIQ